MKIYFFNNKSIKETHRLFKEKFDYHYTVPDSTINRIASQFQTEHMIMCRKDSGKRSTATLEKKEEVMAAVRTVI